MKIEVDDNEGIAVTLTESDMKELDITYESMDYSNIETRRVIWTVLDEAKRALGIPINIDNRLLVQVSPRDSGGCVIRFSQASSEERYGKKRLIMKKDTDPILFCPFDDDAFTESYPVLKELSKNARSLHIYRHGSSFRIIVHPSENSVDIISARLCEYGTVRAARKKDISLLHEEGVLLSPE